MRNPYAIKKFARARHLAQLEVPEAGQTGSPRPPARRATLSSLGVKESGMVLDMVKQLRESGLAIILISHNMPHVWEVADRIHIQRLGGCAGVITPQSHDMGEGVAVMTGATTLAQP